MRKILAAVVVALVVFAAGVYAQDRIFAFRGAFTDTVIGQPCGEAGLKGAASMTVYDTSAWIVYTCTDDRVVLRRYFNPNDNVKPIPTAPQSATISCPADTHPSCKVLPAGVYQRAWADTIGR
jgi:hypothetical protein